MYKHEYFNFYIETFMRFVTYKIMLVCMKVWRSLPLVCIRNKMSELEKCKDEPHYDVQLLWNIELEQQKLELYLASF